MNNCTGTTNSFTNTGNVNPGAPTPTPHNTTTGGPAFGIPYGYFYGPVGGQFNGGETNGYTPNFFNPNFVNPSFANPNFVNPSFANPNFFNPFYNTPNFFNPGFYSPNYQNPSFFGGFNPLNTYNPYNTFGWNTPFNTVTPWNNWTNSFGFQNSFNGFAPNYFNTPTTPGFFNHFSNTNAYNTPWNNVHGQYTPFFGNTQNWYGNTVPTGGVPYFGQGTFPYAGYSNFYGNTFNTPVAPNTPFNAFQTPANYGYNAQYFPTFNPFFTNAWAVNQNFPFWNNSFCPPVQNIDQNTFRRGIGLAA